MMNTFVDSISAMNSAVNNETTTHNGMKALKSTTSSCVDLFFKAGAMRGQDVRPLFARAFAENRDHALRIAQWVRDVRSGAGERKLFRDMLLEVEKLDDEIIYQLLKKVPELGRWDDLLIDFKNEDIKNYVYIMIYVALKNGDGLCAKWMPRKGTIAKKLRESFGWTPKYYRKRLVELTNVVESPMCKKEWDTIDFNKVPSLAVSRYKKAFSRHTPNYAKWTAALVSTDPEVKKTVKVNASAVYPYDVLKGWEHAGASELQQITAQWEALPNYMNGASIMALVDVSGSMTSFSYYQGNPTKNISPLNIALSLGLYIADKGKGAFKDIVMTFSSSSDLYHLKGSILQKLKTMNNMSWGGYTNLHAGFDRILSHAIEHAVPESDMPKILLIMSDMQFNGCVTYNHSALQMMRNKYDDAGYEMPQIVFWNINSHDNVPMSVNTNGVALVSGFSPSIVKSILEADMKEFTPTGMMLKTIMNDRYRL